MRRVSWGAIVLGLLIIPLGPWVLFNALDAAGYVAHFAEFRPPHENRTAFVILDDGRVPVLHDGELRYTTTDRVSESVNRYGAIPLTVAEHNDLAHRRALEEKYGREAINPTAAESWFYVGCIVSLLVIAMLTFAYRRVSKEPFPGVVMAFSFLAFLASLAWHFHTAGSLGPADSVIGPAGLAARSAFGGCTLWILAAVAGAERRHAGLPPAPMSKPQVASSNWVPPTGPMPATPLVTAAVANAPAFCSKCGRPLKSDSAFCSGCGTKVT
jgi:hypothetical protein